MASYQGSMDISVRAVRILEIIDTLYVRVLCSMLVASEGSARGAHFGVTCEACTRSLAPGWFHLATRTC